MKASRSLGRLVVALLSLSSVSPAWAWSLPTMNALVVPRADPKSTPTTSPPKQTPPPDPDNSFNANTGATGTNTDKTTGKKTTEKVTGTGKGSTPTGSAGGDDDSDGDSTKGPKNSTTTHPTFNPVDPAGGVVMMTPAITDSFQLYKIGQFVTWGWNYTNLQGTPTAIDVLASCSIATRTFTLTQNMTFETQGSFTWDTGAYQSNNIATPLLTEEYTLIIYDADSSISATAEAGYLGTFNGFTFGMYAGQSYTPLSDGWTCATCSGAISDMEKRALGFALTMSIVTVLSFTWFVTGMRLTI